MSRVPVGAYKDELWEAVPNTYLYFIVNNYDGAFADDCRREVMKRRALLDPVDPWAAEKGALPTNAGV